MVDLLIQFKNIIETTSLSIIDVACIVYIFKQIVKLIIFAISKIKGEKKK